MKPEHIEKALKLRNAYNVAKDQFIQLANAPSLHVQFFNREVVVYAEDPQFLTMQHSMQTFLRLRMDAIVREANQIGLMLESPVS